MILEQLEKLAKELIDSEDPVVREAGLKIMALAKYLRWYYESPA
ncbi:hypothetical protein Pogu_1344 [Pyrobaculum oguniense TE7]|uniref:Uncharacterized protein n=1 Tax=Pyrobaculum oguniense (strain DSM 13380 / JCM 10595 / TE7) TaxID=698757 RepID=H6Q8Z2_PYROT|nr:hypothetical protein Pogu_1344 [Pyrobaculum oguniense TE7]